MTKPSFTNQLYELLVNTVLKHAEANSTSTSQILLKLEELNKELTSQLRISEKEDTAAHFEIAKTYQHWKLEAFEKIHHLQDQPFTALDTDLLFKNLQELVSTQPKWKELVQKKARFYTQKGDKWWKRLIKASKRFFFQLFTLPKRLFNLSLKIFGKKTRHISYWKHKVPYRKVVEFHIERQLASQLKTMVDDYARNEISIINDALSTEQKLNNDLIAWTLHQSNDKVLAQNFEVAVEKNIDGSKINLNQLKKSIKELCEDCWNKITDTTDIAGTLELPNFILNYKNRKSKKVAQFKSLNNANYGWGKTLFALFEDWKLDQEIYNLNYFTKQKTEQLISENYEHKKLQLELLEASQNSIADFSSRVQKQILEDHSLGKIVIQKAMNEVKHGEYMQKLDQAIENSVAFNTPQKIDQFESKVSKFLKEVAHKRWLTSLTTYDKPLSSSDLSSFSPRELIGFEYLPKLEESCNKLKARLTKEIEKSRVEIDNLEHIIAFNLSSVIDSLEKKECKPSELPELVEEGLERSRKKLGEILKSTEDVYTEVASELNEFTNNFIESNLKLTNNENAFNLRIIVMRAKALKKSEEYGEHFLTRLKVLWRFSIYKGNLLFKQVQKWLLPWKRRIGLETESEIATELSDFLYEAYRKINNLPIIYQRLYKISPLTEMNLFMGRNKEIAALKNAFSSWEEGNYAPTIITGEKWSGQTTIISYFLGSFAPEHKVLAVEMNRNIGTSADLLSLWQKQLHDKKLDSEEAVIKKIKGTHQGSILIVENLQNYYLRQIHGFEALKSLIRIISKTAKDVFWLCSANIYAWNYLNKTINLAGYFGHTIEILPFTNDELREIIMKKNNISGYKIFFTATEKILNNKSYIKKSEEDKQLYLRDKFFTDLNNFAKGNISLALSFWLLSTSNITDDSIEITSFSPPDFSFIKGLSIDIVFIIYQIIMHDGLKADEILLTINQPESQLYMKLTMLYDDGILIIKDEQYQLNPLIYRHTINMLKSKNLIY